MVLLFPTLLGLSRIASGSFCHPRSLSFHADKVNFLEHPTRRPGPTESSSSFISNIRRSTRLLWLYSCSFSIYLDAKTSPWLDCYVCLRCQGSKKLQQRHPALQTSPRSRCSSSRQGYLRCVVFLGVLLIFICFFYLVFLLILVTVAVAAMFEPRRPVRRRGCPKSRTFLQVRAPAADQPTSGTAASIVKLEIQAHFSHY